MCYFIELRTRRVEYRFFGMLRNVFLNILKMARPLLWQQQSTYRLIDQVLTCLFVLDIHVHISFFFWIWQVLLFDFYFSRWQWFNKWFYPTSQRLKLHKDVRLVRKFPNENELYWSRSHSGSQTREYKMSTDSDPENTFFGVRSKHYTLYILCLYLIQGVHKIPRRFDIPILYLHQT